MVMISDPIGDLLTRMRNAQAVRHASCTAPWSRLKQELCELLKQEGWIGAVEILGEKPKQQLSVTFIPGKHIDVRRMSTPGRRLYAKSSELKPVLRGYGAAILTTSQGLLTDREARKRKVGGEVLCTIS